MANYSEISYAVAEHAESATCLLTQNVFRNESKNVEKHINKTWQFIAVFQAQFVAKETYSASQKSPVISIDVVVHQCSD